MNVAPLSPYDTNIGGVLSTELTLVTLDTLNMEVNGKEVSLFFRHNMKLKDIKTGLAKNMMNVGAEVFTMSKDADDVSLRWVPATSTSIPDNVVVISHCQTGEEIFLGKFREVKRGYGYVFRSKGLLFESEFYENFAILCHFEIKIN